MIVPPHRLTTLLVSCAVLFQINAASAIGLLQAYEEALQNDPAHRAAIHENRAGQEFRVIGRAGLLPTLSANYTVNYNQQDFTRQSITIHRSYESESGGVQLRQPIINLGALAGYRQGVSRTRESDARFSIESQDLIVRLVDAYAEAKHAEDQLALAAAQLAAYAEQRQANERMLEKGEGTKTDMLETQARFDVAEAEVLEAQDNVVTARETLRAVVGHEVTGLDSLTDDFRVKSMNPEGFDDWKRIALENNPEIAAQRHAVEAAREEINKQRAGHFPKLDLVAAVTRNKSDSPILVGIDALTQSIGVQANIPIYAGGSVSAVTAQAASNYEKAKADLDTKTSRILVELRKQYSLTLTSSSRITALAKSVDSASFLVEATQKSIKGGIRTNLDFLNAYKQLFESKRDLARVRYNYLLGYLRLRKAAGIVGAGDLHDIAGYFVSRNSSTPMSDARTPPSINTIAKTIE
jgi:protease secretion system outer membrane protein